MIFGLFTLLVALTLSIVAAYYSVLGLTSIFAAATIPVIIMGAALELGKVTATVWLHKNWNRSRVLYKLYLIPAVIFLMLLTSMGIFGFLSKAHSDQGLVSGDVLAKISIYDEKIKVSKENIEFNRKALKQLDDAVEQVMARSTTEQGAERSNQIRRQQARERSRLLAAIEAEQKVIGRLNDERAPIAAEVRKVEAEVGPIKYIAALIYGDEVDQNLLERSVRWVIILIVIVFDPLALVLILAGTLHIEWTRAEKNKKDVDEIKEEPQAKQDLDETVDDHSPNSCPNCQTDLINASEFGMICPNQDCKIQDPVRIAEEILELQETKEQEDLVEHVMELLPENTVEIVNLPEAIDLPKKTTNEVPLETQAPPPKKIVVPKEAHDPMSRKVDDLSITADNESQPKSHVKAHFGVAFPESPERDELFLRVDFLPSKLFKFNGKKWLEVDKSLVEDYKFDTEYIKYLISEIESGRCDVTALSESERKQIENYLKQQ